MLLTSENTVKGAQILSFTGRFDKYAKDNLEAAIVRAQEADCHQIILNLACLAWIDSTGLGRILLTHYRLQPQGIRVSLINPTPRVREMLELVRIPDIIPIFDTSEEAMEKQEHRNPNPVPRRASKRRSPLERKEVHHLLNTVNEKFPHVYPLILCAVRTGLRQGELIGLQWGDVDFHGGFIEVRRGVVLRQETTTKSHKIRRVDMSQQLQDTLKQLKEVRQIEAMVEGQELTPSVFLAKGGNRWDDRHLRRVWVKCLEGAGLRHVRFHDLRHTYASELAEQGAPPKYVQSQLGHSSIQVTMDIYSHFFEKRSLGWVNKLDEQGERPLERKEQSATQAQPEELVF